MEIIGIETATYEKTLKEIENFLDTIDKLITASSHKTIGEWLDNQEVCLIQHSDQRIVQIGFYSRCLRKCFIECDRKYFIIKKKIFRNL